MERIFIWNGKKFNLENEKKSMKKTIFLTATLFAAFASFSQGIEFEHDKSFDEVLAMAKAENKVIFMDCFTTWCGPCKRLAAAVFPDPEVGEYFNAHFINTKFDMEKGDGQTIARRYEIRAYPTLLWIDGNGDVKHKVVGGLDPKGLIEAGQVVGGTESPKLPEFQKKYDSGDRDPVFVEQYISLLPKSNPNFNTVFDSYLKSLKTEDLKNTNHAKCILNATNDFNSLGAKYILQNRAAFANYIGAEKLDAKVKTMASNALSDAVKTKNTNILTQAQSYLKSYSPTLANSVGAKLNMEYALKVEDWKNYDKYASTFIKKSAAKNPDLLNEVAWNYYINIENKKQLEKAKKWAFSAVSLKNNAANNTTYAYLNYKLGNVKEAVRACDYALIRGKEENTNVESARLLKDMLLKSEKKD